MNSKQRLTELHPEITKRFLETYSVNQSQGDWREKHTNRILAYLDNLVDMNEMKNVAVVGCGPVPETIRAVSQKGYNVTGYEPVKEYVEQANRFLEGRGVVYEGWCEKMPADDEAFDIIFCESVLEHVDSPEKSLDEFYRVLKPGGVVYIATENRHRISFTGHNSEYRVRFYNWYPPSVKEGYINKHLNSNPSLASYTPIPAVNWFTYAELCRLGRYAGFGKFYSLVDVMEMEDPKIGMGAAGRLLLRIAKKNMWFRALFLSQRGGGTVFMYKRER